MQTLSILQRPKNINAFPAPDEAVIMEFENKFLRQRAPPAVHHASSFDAISSVRRVQDECIAGTQDRALAWLQVGLGHLVEIVTTARRRGRSAFSGVTVETKYVNRSGVEYIPRTISSPEM